jgi:hypothetical protein
VVIGFALLWVTFGVEHWAPLAVGLALMVAGVVWGLTRARPLRLWKGVGTVRVEVQAGDHGAPAGSRRSIDTSIAGSWSVADPGRAASRDASSAVAAPSREPVGPVRFTMAAARSRVILRVAPRAVQWH